MQQPLFYSYFEYLQKECRRPRSSEDFPEWSRCKDEYGFSSFREWEKMEIAGTFLKTKTLLTSDPTFSEYGTREQILAMVYTWLEILEPYRDFLHLLHQIDGRSGTSRVWDEVKPLFLDWTGGIIEEGLETRQVANRPLIPTQYPTLLWTNMISILAYWLEDSSEEFIKTDQFIEKGLNFLFDLIQPNALDSGWDFIRFFLPKP